MNNPFNHIVEPLDPSDPKQQFFNLSKLGDPRYGKNKSVMNVDIEPVVGVV